MQPPEELRYTPKEVARLYRVHTATVRRWARMGMLPVERVGKQIYIVAEGGKIRLKTYKPPQP